MLEIRVCILGLMYVIYIDLGKMVLTDPLVAGIFVRTPLFGDRVVFLMLPMSVREMHRLVVGRESGGKCPILAPVPDLQDCCTNVYGAILETAIHGLR